MSLSFLQAVTAVGVEEKIKGKNYSFIHTQTNNKKNIKMVVGEAQNGSIEDGERQQHPQSTHPSINQATIDNIMSGIENTGAVKMNNHRKKLRQR